MNNYHAQMTTALAETIALAADAYYNPSDATPAAKIGSIRIVQDYLDEMLAAEVHRARSLNTTWAEIGCYLGTTRQAAQQRFGARTPIADGTPLF